MHPAAFGPPRTTPGHPGPPQATSAPPQAHLLATPGHLGATPKPSRSAELRSPWALDARRGTRRGPPRLRRRAGPGTGARGPRTGVVGGCSPRLPAGGRRRPKVPLGHCSGAAAGGGRASLRAGAPNLGPPPALPVGSATPQPHLFLRCSSRSSRSRFADRRPPMLRITCRCAERGGRGERGSGQCPHPMAPGAAGAGYQGRTLAPGKNHSPTFPAGSRQL